MDSGFVNLVRFVVGVSFFQNFVYGNEFERKFSALKR